MKYDTKKANERQNAIDYFKKLLDKKYSIEVKRIFPSRSISQNAYVHVLFSLYGLEFGHTLEAAKSEVKYLLNYYKISESGAMIYAKTSKMNSKELTEFIDKFKIMASNQGCYLPDPNGVTSSLYNYIEQNKEFLESIF